MELYKYIEGSSAAAIVISMAVMLLVGFLMTRLTKLLHFPNVTAYIVTGVVIGPYCLNIIPQGVISGMDFISDIALAFIAFSAGEYFKVSKLKHNGRNLLIITLFESLLATILVFVLTFFILKLSLPFSIILAALASATAPASTLMTIRQTGAKGEFVDTLLGAVALDDIVSLLAYSVAVSIAVGALGQGVTAGDVILPIVYNIALVLIGCAFGILLKYLMAKRSNDNRLIVSVAFLLGICGIGAILDTSPLLACMAMGMVYINTSNDEKLFKQLNYFSPPILLLFFVRSGLGFDLGSLFEIGDGTVPLILVGILYFLVRIVGKYVGAFLGSWICKKPKNIRNYLGLALFPQAGVAIGLGTMGARILGGEAGNILLTIVLSSSILYELIGPVCAKLSLYLSKSYGDNVEVEKPKTEIDDVDLLKDKLYQIEKEIASREYSRSEEEKAFMEVAEEDESISDYMKKKFINRR